MAYIKQNDSILLEDSESSLDQIHAEFLRHFNDEIRISNMGTVTEEDAATDVDKLRVGDCDKEASDHVATDAVHKGKLRRDSDVSNAVPQSDESKLFDAGGSSSGSGGGGGGSTNAAQVQHCFVPSGSQNGSNINSFVFGCISTSPLEKSEESSTNIALPVGNKGRSVSKNNTIGRLYRKVKEPPLNVSFPSKLGSYELKILKQPEEQHRARYLTEGSRGTVKDQSGQGHPTIKLVGYDQPVPLQVFVGTDVGRMKPHGFYQACKVSNKNSTACVERDIEGTTVIEIMFNPKQEMVAVVDCVGILKLRNADVEQRIGLAKSKKKSTCARLIFRINIPRSDGTFHTLQVASSPIICTQPTGAPEISKKSINQCSVKGGEEMFIIGKNFMKGTVVYFEEVKNDQAIWSKEAEIDQDFFQATHLVCTVPSYRSIDIKYPVQVQIVVHSSGRISDPVSFTYLPSIKNTVLPSVEVSIPMETEPTAVAKNSPQEGSGLKRPYESSPHSDANYVRSAGDVSTEVSHILGHNSAAVDFRDVRDKFTDSKMVAEKEAGVVPLSAQSLFDMIPGMDPLSKNSGDAFILPMQPLDKGNVPAVDNIPCFTDSKEGVAIAGVYDSLYDSSVGQNLVGKVLSSHTQRELDNQLSNLIEVAHQQMRSTLTHDGLLQANALGRSEQIAAVQSPTDHVAPLIGGVQTETLDYGEPQSKRLASYQQSNLHVEMLMQLLHADEENNQKLKPKDEMSWSSLPSATDAAFSLNSDSNLQSLGGPETHDSCHGTASNQLEDLSTFALKTFDSVSPSTSSVPQPPMLFDFEHSVMQAASFLQSPVADVKPDPNFSGINAFLHDSIRYTNSSSPQSMDTSGPGSMGLFHDGHVAVSYPGSSGHHEDEKSSLFGTHLQPDPQKSAGAVAASSFHNNHSLSDPSSSGNVVLGSNSNPVHLVSIRGDSCEVVGMDFRNLTQSSFATLKTDANELRNMIESHQLTDDGQRVSEINQIGSQSLILHHGGMNSSDLALLGITQVTDSEQNLHSYAGQDQPEHSKQQHFSQSGHIEGGSFSDGDIDRLNKIPDCIGIDLPDVDSLMQMGSPQSTVRGLNSIAGLHQVQITSGSHLPDLDHGASHTSPVLNLSNIGPLMTAAVTVAPDNCHSTDGGSMQSNLQQSLSELQDLQQQVGFSGPQSPTRTAKISLTQSDLSSINQENNLSPKSEFSVANESNLLTTPTVLRVQQGHDALHSMPNCTTGCFGSSELTSLQGSLDLSHQSIIPETTCGNQTVQDETTLTELYYKLLTDMSTKSESPLISPSNHTEAALDRDVLILPHPSLSVAHILTTKDSGFICTNSGVTSDATSLQQQQQQGMSQPLLSQHSSPERQVLLLTSDGSSVMVPLSSIMMPSSTVANKATLVDCKDVPVVGTTIMQSGKVICLPPNLISTVAGKTESGLPEVSQMRQVLVVPAGSLKQQTPVSSLQMTTGHLSSDASNNFPSSTPVDSPYCLTISNGTGSIKFLPNTTAVPPPPPQSIESTLADHRRFDQPMDISSPFNHFAHETAGHQMSEADQRNCDPSRNNKMPGLLYQLLTTNDTNSTLRGSTNTTAATSGLPNLSVDDVSQVLDMNRPQQEQKHQ